MSDKPIPYHEEAWDLAHFKADTSNLARCYLDLREAAQAAVDTYYIASGKVKDSDGQDGYNPLRRLRIICETNLDASVRPTASSRGSGIDPLDLITPCDAPLRRGHT